MLLGLGANTGPFQFGVLLAHVDGEVVKLLALLESSDCVATLLEAEQILAQIRVRLDASV